MIRFIVTAVFFFTLLFPVSALAYNDRNQIAQTTTRNIEETINNQNEVRAERVQLVEEARDLAKLRIAQSREDLLEKFNEVLANLNSKWMNRWEVLYDRMAAILIKVETRTDKMQESGFDVTEVRPLLVQANEDLASAQTAIRTQSTKKYILEDSENLMEEFQLLRQELRADHTEIKDLLKSAHTNMTKAIRILSSLNNNGNNMGANKVRITPSPTASE